jgi:hypothetical protein
MATYYDAPLHLSQGILLERTAHFTLVSLSRLFLQSNVGA